MELDFIKLSPLGNTTVFLRGKAAQEARAALLAEAMDYDHLAAEQAGVLVAPHAEEALLRIEMSGGEFCGNATLSAAALAAAEGAESILSSARVHPNRFGQRRIRSVRDAGWRVPRCRRRMRCGVFLLTDFRLGARRYVYHFQASRTSSSKPQTFRRRITTSCLPV